MRTGLVLDTLEMALWSRDRAGLPVAAGLIHHHDAGSQYTQLRLHPAPDRRRRRRLGRHRSATRYDNALAESTIGLYKTEKIRREGPWKTLADVELATLEWVDWFNTTRLHSACGRLSPAQFEHRYLRSTSDSIKTASNEPGAVQLAACRAGVSRRWCDRLHPRERSLPGAPVEMIVRMNRSFAKALLALSYPVRLSAHLSEPAARRGGERQAGARGHADRAVER